MEVMLLINPNANSLSFFFVNITLIYFTYVVANHNMVIDSPSKDVDISHKKEVFYFCISNILSSFSFSILV